MNVQYISSGGQTYDLNGGWPIRIKKANFHAYEWKYSGTEQQYGVDIARFEKEPCEYEAKIYFKGTPTEREMLIRAFHESATYDVIYQSPGRIVWGEYYIQAYVLSSSTYPHDEDAAITVNDVVFLCPRPFWVKEQISTFEKRSESEDLTGIDYAFDYSFDYKAALASDKLYIDHFIPSDFQMVIYGPCTDPSVTINGHIYQVFKTLGEGEYLVIDSRAHTVLIYRPAGIVENAYNARYKVHSIFEKISPGVNSVVRNSQFTMIITLYLERNEPIWS